MRCIFYASRKVIKNLDSKTKGTFLKSEPSSGSKACKV